MDLKEEMQGDVLVIALEGELMGGDESRQFQDRITQAIKDDTTSITVNMADVKWMNSSGLGLLMASLTTLRGSGGDLRLAQVPDRVQRPIEVTKLDKVIKMFTTVDEAVQSYTSGG